MGDRNPKSEHRLSAEKWLALTDNMAEAERVLARAEGKIRSISKDLYAIEKELCKSVGASIRRRIFAIESMAVIVKWEGDGAPATIIGVKLE